LQKRGQSFDTIGGQLPQKRALDRVNSFWEVMVVTLEAW